jgi:hypothetical protein
MRTRGSSSSLGPLPVITPIAELVPATSVFLVSI